MKLFGKYVLFVLSTSLINSMGYAAEFKILPPTYGGSGCLQGSSSAIVSEDQRKVDLTFPLMIVEAVSPKFPTRKSCSIAIPIQVSPGYRIAVKPTEYQGAVLIGTRGFAHFSVESFFAGTSGRSSSVSFDDRHQGPFIHVHSPETLTWSGCGEDVNFRVNFTILASSMEPSVPTWAALEKISGYEFIAEPCPLR